MQTAVGPPSFGGGPLHFGKWGVLLATTNFRLNSIPVMGTQKVQHGQKIQCSNYLVPFICPHYYNIDVILTLTILEGCYIDSLKISFKVN